MRTFAPIRWGVYQCSTEVPYIYIVPLLHFKRIGISPKIEHDFFNKQRSTENYASQISLGLIVLLPPASKGWRKVMFSLGPPLRGDPYSSQWGGGTPSFQMERDTPILLTGGTLGDWMGGMPPVQD